VIKELDENIQKYASDKVNARDIVRVANVIANKTITNLEQLNKTAREDPEEFVRKLQKISDKEKEIEGTRKKELNDLLLQIREDADIKLKETIEGLKIAHTTNLKSIVSSLNEEFSKKLIDQQLLEKNNRIDLLNKAIEPLLKAKESYDRHAEKNASKILFLIFFGPIILLFAIYFKIGWSKIEPWTFLLAFLTPITSYLYFALKKKELSIKTIWEDLKENRKTKYYTKHNFDIAQYDSLRKNIEDLKHDRKNKPNR
jgi:Fe2+ transport system protein B